MNSDVRTVPGKGWQAALWTAQVLLAAIYLPAGLMKLTMPVADVAAQIPWAGAVPVEFLRFIGLVDLSAGLGILLPTLLRISPRLTVSAAIGSSILQLFAMVFHTYRGELMVLPFNLLILALSVYVAWGRTKKAPIPSRGAVSLASSR